MTHTQWRDLTRPIRTGMAVYTEPGYHDVHPQITSWCDVPSRGFATERLVLGTQTGTHIDAPAHFVTGGSTLDALPADAGIGDFHLVRPTTTGWAGRTDPTDTKARILVLELRGPALSVNQVRPIVQSAPRLVVFVGEATVQGPDPLLLNRSLAEAGVFVVEDLVPPDADLPERGRIVVAWPNLVGTGGAPCRVLVSGAAG